MSQQVNRPFTNGGGWVAASVLASAMSGHAASNKLDNKAGAEWQRWVNGGPEKKVLSQGLLQVGETPGRCNAGRGGSSSQA